MNRKGKLIQCWHPWDPECQRFFNVWGDKCKTQEIDIYASSIQSLRPTALGTQIRTSSESSMPEASAAALEYLWTGTFVTWEGRHWHFTWASGAAPTFGWKHPQFLVLSRSSAPLPTVPCEFLCFIAAKWAEGLKHRESQSLIVTSRVPSNFRCCLEPHSISPDSVCS